MNKWEIIHRRDASNEKQELSLKVLKSNKEVFKYESYNENFKYFLEDIRDSIENFFEFDERIVPLAMGMYIGDIWSICLYKDDLIILISSDTVTARPKPEIEKEYYDAPIHCHHLRLG